MQKPTRLGRPIKSAEAVTKEKIHQAAFQLLKQGGLDALTFRALATRLGVTPMAITHHTGSRKELLIALITSAFSDVSAPSEGKTPRARIMFLLSRYCDQAAVHAPLIQAMLTDSTLICAELWMLTQSVRHELTVVTDAATVTPVLNLLIDYTHGFVISAATTPEGQGPDRGEYKASIDWVLDQL